MAREVPLRRVHEGARDSPMRYALPRLTHE